MRTNRARGRRLRLGGRSPGEAAEEAEEAEEAETKSAFELESASEPEPDPEAASPRKDTGSPSRLLPPPPAVPAAPAAS